MTERMTETARMALTATAGYGSAGTAFIEQIQPWISASAGVMTTIWLVLQIYNYGQKKADERKGER